VLGVLSIVLAVLAIWFPEALKGPSPMTLGQTGDTGPMSVTVSNVVCGKALPDLPEYYRKYIKKQTAEFSVPFYKGQLCLAQSKFRNNGNKTLSVLPVSTMHVGEDEYPVLTSIPPKQPTAPLTLFPEESTDAIDIFDIPKAASPTRLSYQWGDEDKVVFEPVA
jgi:hypothetical protein